MGHEHVIALQVQPALAVVAAANLPDVAATHIGAANGTHLLLCPVALRRRGGGIVLVQTRRALGGEERQIIQCHLNVEARPVETNHAARVCIVH